MGNTPNIYYRVYKNEQLVPIQCQANPVDILTPCFCEIHFIFFRPFTLVFWTVPSLPVFRLKRLYAYIVFTMRAICLAYIILLYLNTVMNIKKCHEGSFCTYSAAFFIKICWLERVGNNFRYFILTLFFFCFAIWGTWKASQHGNYSHCPLRYKSEPPVNTSGKSAFDELKSFYLEKTEENRRRPKPQSQ